MSLRSKFDEVRDSIVSGQRKQAAEQMDEIGMSDLPEMLDYFVVELSDPELAIEAAKSYFRIKAR